MLRLLLYLLLQL